MFDSAELYSNDYPHNLVQKLSLSKTAVLREVLV